MVWFIITTLIGGLIIGLLGKLVAPGDKDNIPLWLTLVCGIGGMLIGSYLYFALFGADKPGGDWTDTTNGIDWWRHLWQVVIAAVLVVIASTLTGRSRRV